VAQQWSEEQAGHPTWCSTLPSKAAAAAARGREEAAA
jgi:hypothetical protein